MKYFIQLKNAVDEKDASGWKEKITGTPGVTLISPIESDVLIIEAGFDPIHLIRRKLGSICKIEGEIEHRFDI